MHDKVKEGGLFFEISWEVCNKIGGIYTVLSTKAKTLKQEFDDNLVFIGPDVWTDEDPSPYFNEDRKLFGNLADKLLLPYDIKIRIGRWSIPGEPIVVLVDFKGAYAIKDDVYGQIWSKYGVDSLHAYGDYDEGCTFGIASAIVISAIKSYLKKESEKVIAHFNEWTTGMGLLYLQTKDPKIATLFTTHATSIGRSICGNGKPLYDYLEGYNGDQMAQELNMQSKHSLEKAAAHNADCFTTVSEVTAVECQQLLELYPQVVTPNGFESDFVAKGRKLSLQRKKSRQILLNVASAVTGCRYSDETFLIATSGRNEYRNKGIDLFIDAIDDLQNDYPQTTKDLIAFIMVPAWVANPKENVVAHLNGFEIEAEKGVFLTHQLNNEQDDKIACRLRNLGVNKQNSRVSIIYIPCYLNGGDGVVNLSYYDMMPALDATIFPSYYEPWGYTPLESIAFGVPTISSDKAGFGQWIISNFKNDFLNCGVNVVTRTDSNYESSKRQIKESLMSLLTTSDKDIKKISTKAKTTSKKAEWMLFIEKYIEAFNIALERRDKRINK